jgi:hypothetical protein
MNLYNLKYQSKRLTTNNTQPETAIKLSALPKMKAEINNRYQATELS